MGPRSSREDEWAFQQCERCPATRGPIRLLRLLAQALFRQLTFPQPTTNLSYCPQASSTDAT